MIMTCVVSLRGPRPLAYSLAAFGQEEEIIKLEASCMWILGCYETVSALGLSPRLAGTCVVLRMLVAIL